MTHTQFTNNIKAVQTMEKAFSLAFSALSAAHIRSDPTFLGAMRSVCLVADERCAQSTVSAAES